MPETVSVNTRLDTGWQFIIGPETEHPVTLDGNHITAFSPMEMLLGSLASCSGVSVYSILQKKRVQVTHYEVRASGVRADEHPKVYTQIALEHIVTGHNVKPTSIESTVVHQAYTSRKAVSF